MITFIESPYFGHRDSCRYLACCILDVFQRGEIPFASHGLYPLGLPELVEMSGSFGHNRTGRELGIGAASQMKAMLHCACVPFFLAFYGDLGISPGAHDARNEAVRLGYRCVTRTLSGQALRIWLAGEWPTMARLTHNHEVTT